MANPNQPCCSATKYFPGRFESRVGQKASVHWLLFTDYYKFHQISDANAIKEFMFTLGDEPRIWYDDNVALFTDLKALERSFKSAFGRAATREEHLSAFSALTYTSGEPLNSYRNRVRSTAARAKITDQEHIRLQFINGFPSHIRSALRAKRDTSLDDCMLTAQALLSETPDIPTPAMPIVPAAQTNALASRIGSIITDVQHGTEQAIPSTFPKQQDLSFAWTTPTTVSQQGPIQIGQIAIARSAI